MTSTFLLGLLFFFTAPILGAQEMQGGEAGKRDSSVLRTQKRLPILNGFRFMPSDVVRDPFINTFMKLNAGAGVALDLKSYVKDLQGNVADTLSGDLTYLSAEMEFQYAANDWLAFSGSYRGSGRLGTNAYTVLTAGISYTTGFTLGTKIRLWENDNMFLSGGIDYSSTVVTLYSIYDFVKQVYESGGNIDSSKASLLQEDDLSKIFLTFNYAYAPTDWLGLLGVAGIGEGGVFNGKDKGNVRLGAAVSVDFLNVQAIEFPIGILVSFRYNSFSESGEDVNNVVTFGVRIGYT
jgi:hypothetical protein